jgi:ABC-type glycerol-3-phosphate transport system permease component
MPVISKIGQRSWKVRCVIFAIYAVLILGGASMIYPMMLMVSGSVKSDTDYARNNALPRYLFDDQVLWAKYLESKYGTIPEAEKALHTPVDNWRKIQTPSTEELKDDRIEPYRAFREQADWPDYWYRLGHMGLGPNERAYLRLAQDRYDDDITAFSDAAGLRYKSWSQVTAPLTPLDMRHYTFPDSAGYQMLRELKREAPESDRVVMNLDGAFWNSYLRSRWATIDKYNQTHGTHYEQYNQVLLTTRPPARGVARDDWEEFVRNDLNIRFIRIDPDYAPAFQSFLQRRYDNKLGELNRLWETHYTGFDQIPLHQVVSGTPSVFFAYAEFVSAKSDDNSGYLCPLDALSVFGPRQGFERYLAKTQGISPDQIEHKALPIEAVDYLDFAEQTGSLRWEFLKRNYIKVLDYILMHGNGVRNTVIYCGLMILVTLTINPLAAYALSRYKPPSAYKILLFFMCTMAFPPEVTMIPSFLLLKHFPAIGLGVALVSGLLAAWIFHKLAPKAGTAFKGIGAGVIGLLVGFFVLPKLFGDDATNVSLLNTFWALVLPGAANGFGIFLLKGFFDSLPQELYEAAEIDGGGEWTKFWVITMSLSKPILAVLVLQAFTSAYSEFLMALVIIPDPDMWTMMVWLFQLQSQADPYVVNASIVIAAVPTFLIFLFCQNIIMRGIVVPVEK